MCAGFYSPETTRSQAALPSPSPLNMLCFQQVRDRGGKKHRAEPCSAGIQYNFKMTEEESSGASEEDDWDLDADARLSVGWRSASHLWLYTDPTCQKITVIQLHTHVDISELTSGQEKICLVTFTDISLLRNLYFSDLIVPLALHFGDKYIYFSLHLFV